jgi:hypothetical protein
MNYKIIIEVTLENGKEKNHTIKNINFDSNEVEISSSYIKEQYEFSKRCLKDIIEYPNVFWLDKNNVLTKIFLISDSKKVVCDSEWLSYKNIKKISIISKSKEIIT